VSDSAPILHTLDTKQSLVIMGGLFFVRAHTLPVAEGINNLITRLRASRPAAWGVLHFFEFERPGLPDEPTRAAYAALMRDAKQAGRCTALVTERLLMQSIVRSVVSGLRLLTKHEGATETFSSLAEAARWLESKRPEHAPSVTLASLESALHALRDAQR